MTLYDFLGVIPLNSSIKIIEEKFNRTIYTGDFSFNLYQCGHVTFDGNLIDLHDITVNHIRVNDKTIEIFVNI